MRRVLLATCSLTLFAAGAQAQPVKPGGGGKYNLAGQPLGAGVVTGTTMGTVAPVQRALAHRAADIFNVRDYGALGTNSQAKVGTTGCFASFAAFSGSNCYPWATNTSYGLTFSVTIPSTGGGTAGSSTLSFLANNQTWYAGTVANTAAWQFEASSNAPVPGMVVSNGAGTTCIPAGTTVVGVGADPSGTFSTSGVPYGSITLSNGINTRGCVAGNVITFTISTSQLQSLTQDWLGIQNAVANAESQISPGSTNTGTVITNNTINGGAKIFFPAGIYQINHPILYSATSENEDYPSPSVLFEGDNWVTSAIQVPGSAPMMGFDSCVLQPSAWNSSSQINFTNLRLLGSGSGVVGSFPNAYKGLCTSTGSMVTNVSADVFYAGLVIRENHIKVEKSHFEHNGYGIYFSPYTNSNGNISIKESYVVSNDLSAISIATTNQIDASDFDNLHFYGNPFGFYREPKQPNVKTVDAYFLTNSQMRSVYTEQGGNGYIYVDGVNSAGSTPDSSIYGNVFIGGYNLTVGVYNSLGTPGTHGYAWWSTKASPAPIYLQNFTNNTMYSTAWGFAASYPTSFTGPTAGLISVTGSATNNLWVGDLSFPLAGTPTLPSIYAPAGPVSNGNRFEYGSNSGEFFFTASGTSLTAGAPVAQAPTADNANIQIVNYTPGAQFIGIAAVNAGRPSAYTYSPIIEKGVNLNLLTTSTSGALIGNNLLYPTTGGFAPTFSPMSGVALVYHNSAGNGAFVEANLDKSFATAAPLTQVGQTATGSAGSGQFPIVADFTEFTAGPGAQFILNNNLPGGRSEKVCNDTSGSLTGYPPAGATFGASGTTVTLPTNSCATYTKMSATKWSVN